MKSVAIRPRLQVLEYAQATVAEPASITTLQSETDTRHLISALHVESETCRLTRARAECCPRHDRLRRYRQLWSSIIMIYTPPPAEQDRR